jgi:hypothetical protein
MQEQLHRHKFSWLQDHLSERMLKHSPTYLFDIKR